MTLRGEILLLQPWVEDFYTTDCRIQPIGLAYLAGNLRARFPEIDVRIFDTLAGGEKRSIPWPRELCYLSEYYGRPDKGPFRLFHHYYRFGKSDEEILESLRRFDPFLIGISCLFTPYYRQSLALAKLCRRVFPRVPIVMGGSHASLHPETLLAPGPPFRGERLCDYALRGECEESIGDLVEHLSGRRRLDAVSNLVTRETLERARDRLVMPRRATLARPRFDGLDPDAYTYGRRRMSFLVTSRSCPHRCTFCSIHSVFGTSYETRPVGDIVDEILQRSREGVRHFDIEDDNFTFRRTHTLELLDRIIDLRLPVTFSAMNGISYLSLDEEILERMRRAGFETLNIALVSADSLVLAFTRRPHGVERFHRVAASAARLGFRTTAYFILGMPGQTVDEMWGTLEALARTRCLVGASPFYFTPGSPIHVRERDNPRLRLASRGRDPWFSARLTAMDLEEEGRFDRQDIYTLFRMTRVVNHVKRGIDLGLSPDHPHFSSARAVFSEGRWTGRDRSGTYPLPFSERLRELMTGGRLVVRGHLTDREVAWDLIEDRPPEETVEAPSPEVPRARSPR